MEIEINENNFSSLKKIKHNQNDLILKNDSGIKVDGTVLADWFTNIPGIENITSLIIEYNSLLNDLSVVKGLPNLKNIQINGCKIKSLQGLEYFKKGEYIYIDTGENNKRNISELSQTQIKKLSIQVAHKKDLEVISGCLALQHLQLAASPCPLLKEWSKIPLEILNLSRGKFSQITDTAQLSQLKKIVIINCRKLEEFTGNNSKVQWLLIQTCNKLDIKTIVTFTGIESLFINDIKNKFNLSTFSGLNKLKNLSLELCKVNVDMVDIKSSIPEIKNLLIAGLERSQAIKLSHSNPGVSISTGIETFMDGMQLSLV